MDAKKYYTNNIGIEERFTIYLLPFSNRLNVIAEKKI